MKLFQVYTWNKLNKNITFTVCIALATGYTSTRSLTLTLHTLPNRLPFPIYFLICLTSKTITWHVKTCKPSAPQLVRDQRGLGVDERSNFWWWHRKLVWYLNWRKHLFCRSKDDAGIPRGHWSRVLYFSIENTHK